jgi:glucosylceramidase
MLVSSAADPAVRLSERAPSGGGGEPVTVDTGAPGQAWQGVGAALTDDAVAVLRDRPDLVELLVDPAAERGVRLDWLRLPLTATDYSATDWAWTRGDDREVDPPPEAQAALDLLDDEILPRAPDLRLVATPWTAPPELKEPATWHGGALRDDAVEEYAGLLVDQARWLVDAGYPLAAMTLANEPDVLRDYPTMAVSDEQLTALAKLVGPALDELDVDLWALDHNWDERSRVDPALGEYDAVAFHCYGGQPEQAAGLAVPWLVSECTGTTDSAASTLAWDLDVLVDRAVAAGSTGLLMWNPVLPAGHAGREGGCDDCRGLLTADPDARAEPEFYVLAHLARAADPGDRVLPVTGPDDLSLVAFQRSDGRVSVVGHNPGDTPRDLGIQAGPGRAASYSIGPHELFTWTSPARDEGGSVVR